MGHSATSSFLEPVHQSCVTALLRAGMVSTSLVGVQDCLKCKHGLAMLMKEAVAGVPLLSYPSVKEGAAAYAYSNKFGDCSWLKPTAIFMSSPCSGWPCSFINICLQYQERCENVSPKVRGRQGLLLSVAVLI